MSKNINNKLSKLIKYYSLINHNLIFNEKSINTLFQILDLGEKPFASIALWHRNLYLGSSDGKIYKSNRLIK